MERRVSKKASKVKREAGEQRKNDLSSATSVGDGSNALRKKHKKIKINPILTMQFWIN